MDQDRSDPFEARREATHSMHETIDTHCFEQFHTYNTRTHTHSLTFLSSEVFVTTVIDPSSPIGGRHLYNRHNMTINSNSNTVSNRNTVFNTRYVVIVI